MALMEIEDLLGKLKSNLEGLEVPRRDAIHLKVLRSQ